MNAFRRALSEGTITLDGGLGVELLNRARDLERDYLGAPGATALLSVTRPELVREVHEEFLEAGATAISTNTFCADPTSLEAIGQGARSGELVRASVSLARAAAAGTRVPVLGSIGPGPLGASLEGESTERFLKNFVDAGVDALLLETQMDARRFLELLELATRAANDQVERIVSFTCASDGSLPAAPQEAELAEVLEDSGVALVALNCSNGPGPLALALERWRALWSGPLGAYPNAGTPTRDEDGSLSHPIAPEIFAMACAELARRYDLALVGGCCGAGPDHIRALARSVGR